MNRASHEQTPSGVLLMRAINTLCQGRLSTTSRYLHRAVGMLHAHSLFLYSKCSGLDVPLSWGSVPVVSRCVSRFCSSSRILP